MATIISLIPSLTFLAGATFAFALSMNLVRKNTTIVILYLFQSLVVAFALYSLAFTRSEVGLLYAGMLTLMIKAIVAPTFLLQVIKKYNAHLSTSSQLNTPLSLLCLAVITFFTFSFIGPRVAVFSPLPGIPLLFTAIFATLFLMVNRRGALAAVVGILSLENSIVLLTAYLGAEHSFALEFAIAFDIAAWTLIAIGFLNMMYRQFGFVDAATLNMTHLTEE